MVTVRFLQLDFSLLKNAIAAHCREWQTRLINLLMEMTVEELTGIHNYMSDMIRRFAAHIPVDTKNMAALNLLNVFRYARRLSRPPENLAELVESMNLLEKVHNEEKLMEDKFAPIEEQFLILDKCEVNYEHEVSARRANIATDWSAFKDNITNCEEVSTRVYRSL